MKFPKVSDWGRNFRAGGEFNLYDKTEDALVREEASIMYFYCEKCKKQYPLNTHSIRCSCGGLFRLHKDPDEVVPDSVSIGHMITRPGGRRCRCGRRGCWETEIGADALLPDGSRAHALHSYRAVRRRAVRRGTPCATSCAMP